MEISVPSLKSLSLATISTHIWYSWDLSNALIDIDLVSAASDRIENSVTSQRALIPYYSRIKPAYDSIMAMDLMKSVKVQIACAFITLETNILQWAKDMIEIFEKPKRKENIAYCLAKTVVRVNLTIDRETTMFNVLFDSFGRVRLSDYGPGNICVLTVNNLYRFIENNSNKNGKYRRHGWLSKKIRRELRFYKPMKHWEVSMRFMRYLLGRDDYSKVGLLMCAIRSSKLEVFVNLLYKLSNQHYELSLPPKVYTLLLSHAMLGDYDQVTDINIVIFLLDKLHNCDKKLWLTFVTHWFSDIIFQIFMSSDSESSIMYFQEGCELVSPNACADIVKMLFTEIQPTKYPDKHYGQTAVDLKHRAVFFEIWSRTPVKVKQILFDYFPETYLDVSEDKDFYFLSILLTDKAFTADQRNYLVLVKVLAMEKQEHVEALLSHLPEHYRDFVRNPPREALRRYIISSCKGCVFKGFGKGFVLETKMDLNSFNKELFHDKYFVVDACAAMGDNFICDSAYDTLLWFLNTDESVNKFLEEKLVSQQWIVDILKKYLVAETCCGKDSSLIDFFVKDAEERLRLKKVIRKDIPLMLEAVDKVFWDSHPAITDFLSCIFDTIEIEERKALIEMYLFSEKGVRAIRSLVTEGEKIKHVILYTKDNLKKCAISMKSFKRCWLDPYNLTLQVVELLSTMKVRSESPIMFPHQTESDGNGIVRRNLFMFEVILNRNIAVDDLLQEFNFVNDDNDTELEEDLWN